jgi:hypothetical protein
MARKPTRRTVLRFTTSAASLLVGSVVGGTANAFRTDALSGADALAYKDRCKADQFHAATLDAAIARLKASGTAFDENRVRATLVCPICGCPILTAARP